MSPDRPSGSRRALQGAAVAAFVIGATAMGMAFRPGPDISVSGSDRIVASVPSTDAPDVAAAPTSAAAAATTSAVAASIPAHGPVGGSSGSTSPAATSPASVAATSPGPGPAPGPGPEQLGLDVVAVVPHDTGSFTQGLVLDGDVLYESDGGENDSSLRRVDPATGTVEQSVAVAPGYFAEGLALVGDELIQLTWQDGVAFRYDAATFEPRGTFSYDGEGWGLCHDEAAGLLYMSNGSDALTVRDPGTFEVVASVTVTEAGEPVDQLNELECFDGVVYANVWHRDDILRIEAASGIVTAVIDAGDLISGTDRAAMSSEAVLNGIARQDDGDLLITGKLWPAMFEVRIVPIAEVDRTVDDSGPAVSTSTPGS